MIWVTDTVNNVKVAINPQYLVAVFTAPDSGEYAGKTVITMTTGQLVVDEKDFDIVGRVK